MKGPRTLLNFEDNWTTDVGAWFPGERVVFRGKDLFTELKELRWMALLIYGITGRIPNEKQVRLFETFWVLCTSYPDPRLWNNRIAALAGSTRATGALAISAANAISEASIYGRRPDIRSIDLLFRVQRRLEDGEKLKDIVTLEIKKYRFIPGYGRPIIGKDERIEPILTLATELGFIDGVYLKLAQDIEKVLLEGRWRMHMNIAIVLAALAADQGFSRHEYYQFMILSFSGGMFPCYLDTLAKPEGSFFPMRCERIQYEGKSRRNWSDNK